MAGMTCFKSFKNGFVTILDNSTNNVEDGTSLVVRPSFIGDWALQYEPIGDTFHLPQWAIETKCKIIGSQPDSEVLLLQSPYHDKEGDQSTPFSILACKSQDEKAAWSNFFKAITEPSYCKGYSEWLKDILGRHEEMLRKKKIYDAIYASLFSYDRLASVMRYFCEFWSPSTNTLHTSAGERSISLWDLRQLGGLPIRGLMYDEVVPSAEEMTGVGKDSMLYLPVNCRYLFFAYHRLLAKSKKGEVKVDAWVNFWFKGEISYCKSTKKTARNKTQRPAKNNNPTGVIGPVQLRTAEQEQVFAVLGVKGTQKELVYLAAFLACWLCKFVLPIGSCEVIRPGVFKVASMMARGERFSLAIPVLASIYKGLNEIANSSEPWKCDSVFPVHYVYAWLGEYFNTHIGSDPKSAPQKPRMVRYAGERVAKYLDESEALDLFRRCDNLAMDRFAQREGEHTEQIDDGELGGWQIEYFISIRSGFLTLRSGSLRVIEPYSPHRFSSQFGFSQDIPGKLKINLRSGNLMSIVRHWESLVHESTQGKLKLPKRANCRSVPVTEAYQGWWAKVHTDTFSGGASGSKSKKRLTSPMNDVPKVLRCKPNPKVSGTRHRPQPIEILEGDGTEDQLSTERNSDRCWKHVANDRATSLHPVAPFTAQVNAGTFFDGVLSSSRSFPRELQSCSHFEALNNVEEPQGSSDSIQGPDSFDLVARSSQQANVDEVASAVPQLTNSNKSSHPSLSVDKGASLPLLGGQLKISPNVDKVADIGVSKFDTSIAIRDVSRQAAIMLADNIFTLLDRASFEKLPSLQAKFEELY
ncbi:hypothetical protein Vadar_027062 [Vaccinium darrowii]|uniref:Uncharacterized protein n=1 Tax=Vaccinium darrowii TaxID=229202 RepID=A0ACB7Y9V9_9ERIC|nr:hypothetical protein Vadar_027062 [Vaccinium darrowii]